MTYRSTDYGCVYLSDDRCYNIVGIGDVRIRMYDDTVRTLCDHIFSYKVVHDPLVSA